MYALTIQLTDSAMSPGLVDSPRLRIIRFSEDQALSE